ncbi:MAG: F0F1 ATP synthase subunit B [Actinomycetota bacterium]
MGTRQLLAGFAILSIVVALGVAAPASAQEGGDDAPAAEEGAEAEEIELDHANERCIQLLEEGKDIDDCQEAPSPILPETNEIIWGSAAFVVLLIGLWWKGIPAIKSLMAQREDRIRADLERAETARAEGEAVLAQYQALVANARNEAGQIIEEARQAADQVRRDLIARAEAEANEIRARAQNDIAIQRERALAELRVDVAELSIQLAERIVEHNLDRQTQLQLVNSFIEQVGSN